MLCHCITCFASVSHMLCHCITRFATISHMFFHSAIYCASMSHTAGHTTALLPMFITLTTKRPKLPTEPIWTAPTGWTVRNSIPRSSKKLFSAPKRSYWLSGPASSDSMGTRGRAAGAWSWPPSTSAEVQNESNCRRSAALDDIISCTDTNFPLPFNHSTSVGYCSTKLYQSFSAISAFGIGNARNQWAVAEFSVPNALLKGTEQLLNIAPATADIAFWQLLYRYSHISPHNHTCSGLGA